MKKANIILFLVLAGTAAFFLKEGQSIQRKEANVNEQLALLSEAVKKSPAAYSSRTALGSQPPALDSGDFTADLKSLLDSNSSQQGLEDFLNQNEARLASVSPAKLKEICAWLENNYPIAFKEKTTHQLVWGLFMKMIAKSDPTWAIAKFDQTATAANVPSAEMLELFKNWGSRAEEPMARQYAAALQKWLDFAQAAGKIEPGNPLVLELRTEIAVAQGNQSAASMQISQLPHASQREAAIGYPQKLKTPEDCRQAMEELSGTVHYSNFQAFVSSLTAQQGSEAAKEILTSASLTPENYDLAAASIASTKIGPETKDNASWLLLNLRSQDHRALAKFAENWSLGDHAAAANWVNTLPKGSQRDSALRGLIPVASRIDGASAMDWALTVSDPILRNRLYCEAHLKWGETDEAKANAYRLEKPLDQAAVMAASTPNK